MYDINQLNQKIQELLDRQAREELVINELREQVAELSKPQQKLTDAERAKRVQVLEHYIRSCGPEFSNALVYVWKDGLHITVRRVPNGPLAMTYAQVKQKIRRCREERNCRAA